jgi:hypothetical protein
MAKPTLPSHDYQHLGIQVTAFKPKSCLSADTERQSATTSHNIGISTQGKDRLSKPILTKGLRRDDCHRRVSNRGSLLAELILLIALIRCIEALLTSIPPFHRATLMAKLDEFKSRRNRIRSMLHSS